MRGSCPDGSPPQRRASALLAAALLAADPAAAFGEALSYEPEVSFAEASLTAGFRLETDPPDPEKAPERKKRRRRKADPLAAR